MGETTKKIINLQQAFMTPKANKDLSVETLRGIAIVLVVMGHVIGSKSDGGMKVADDSFLRHLYFTFQYLRMPLFTVISGWVYSLRPVSADYVGDFILKKVRRILVPLVMVGGAYYLIQSFVPGTNFSYSPASVWRILVFPYTFYWYLQALFIVFIVVGLIDSKNMANKFSHWVILFVVSIALLMLRDTFIPESVPNYFGFKGGIYLLPFFIIGLGIQRFKCYFANKYFVGILTLVLMAELTIQQLVWYNIVEYEFSNRDGLGLIIGVFGTILLLQIRYKIKAFIWMGNYAYSIFLFHSFGTSGGRIVLNTLGINNTVVVFFFSLVLGLFLPVIAELVLDKRGITRMLFLGRAYTKNKKRNKLNMYSPIKSIICKQ